MARKPRVIVVSCSACRGPTHIGVGDMSDPWTCQWCGESLVALEEIINRALAER